MTRSTLPLLVLVALGTLGTAAYLALAGGDQGSAPSALDPGRPAGSVSQPDRVDAGAEDLATAAGRERGGGAATGRTTGRSTGRTAVNQGARQPDRSRTAGAAAVLLVEIVREEDDRPMSGARVTFLDRSAQDGWQEAWKTRRARQAFLAARGQTLVADAAGILSVPRTTSGALSAQSRGYYGELEWSELPQESLRLVLSAPSVLNVQLVDGSGRPLQGAMVVLTVERDGVRKTLQKQRTTGPTAIAIFRRLELTVLGPDEQLWIEPGFPCAGDPHLKIEAHDLPSEVQRLVVGDTGSLRVLVTDERGRPLEETALVFLGRFETGPAGRTFEGLHGVRLMGGRATFPNLGLGVTVALRLEGAFERAPQLFEVAGPTRPGQVAEARLDWTAMHPVLLVRAVGESGRVLSNRGGTFFVHQGEKSTTGSPVRTDTRGQLRIVIQQPGDGDGPRELEVLLRSSASDPLLEARRALPHPLEGGAHDLGDLLFRSPPALVSGVVRDIGGRPVFGASVRVILSAGSRLGLADRSARTDRRGMFTVYGTCDEQAVSVVVAQRGFTTLRQKNVRPGTSGLELTLITAGGR